MKYTLAITIILAVVAAVCDSSAIKADSRNNLNVGYVAPGDRRVYSNYFNRNAGAANTVQTQDVVWRGNSTSRISAVRATEAGATQWATAFILSGGVGYNNVTVRLSSSRGRGFNYYLEIFGR